MWYWPPDRVCEVLSKLWRDVFVLPKTFFQLSRISNILVNFHKLFAFLVHWNHKGNHQKKFQKMRNHILQLDLGKVQVLVFLLVLLLDLMLEILLALVLEFLLVPVLWEILLVLVLDHTLVLRTVYVSEYVPQKSFYFQRHFRYVKLKNIKFTVKSDKFF